MESKREFISGHAIIKNSANFFFRKNIGGRTSGSKTIFNNNSLDDFVSHIEVFGNTADSFAGDVLLDNIVDIRRELFHGYVYNLQTPKEYYIAEGIAIHNCRCIALPLDVTEGKIKVVSETPAIELTTDKQVEEWQKEAGWNDWMDKIPDAQYRALDRYKGAGYERINEELRTKKISSTIKPYVENIDSAFKSAPKIKDDFYTFRTVSNFDKRNWKDSVGSIFSDKAYMSTTVTKKRMDEFARTLLTGRKKAFNEKDAIFKIRIPKGSQGKGIYIDSLFGTKVTSETEFLLNRNANLKIEKVTKVKGPGNKGFISLVEMVIM